MPTRRCLRPWTLWWVCVGVRLGSLVLLYGVAHAPEAQLRVVQQWDTIARIARSSFWVEPSNCSLAPTHNATRLSEGLAAELAKLAAQRNEFCAISIRSGTPFLAPVLALGLWLALSTGVLQIGVFLSTLMSSLQERMFALSMTLGGVAWTLAVFWTWSATSEQWYLLCALPRMRPDSGTWGTMALVLALLDVGVLLALRFLPWLTAVADTPGTETSLLA